MDPLTMNKIVTATEYQPVKTRGKVIVTSPWIRAATHDRESFKFLPDGKSARTIGRQHSKIKIIAFSHSSSDLVSVSLDSSKVRKEARGNHQDAYGAVPHKRLRPRTRPGDGARRLRT